VAGKTIGVAYPVANNDEEEEVWIDLVVCRDLVPIMTTRAAVVICMSSIWTDISGTTNVSPTADAKPAATMNPR
jgi:hypothetical protein